MNALFQKAKDLARKVCVVALQHVSGSKALNDDTVALMETLDGLERELEALKTRNSLLVSVAAPLPDIVAGICALLSEQETGELLQVRVRQVKADLGALNARLDRLVAPEDPKA
jgi:hypothetical protein